MVRGGDVDDFEDLREPLGNKQQAKHRLDDAIEEIHRLCDEISIEEDVPEAAVRVYKDALDSGLPHYPSAAELTASAVYMACRLTETPRTRQEVANHSSLPRYTYNYPIHEEGSRTELRGGPVRKVNRSYTLISESLLLDPPRLSLSDFVRDYCLRLDTSPEVREVALVVADSIDEQLESGRSAGALAAGIIDYATKICDSDITQQAISDVTHFSITTIRKRRQDIEEDINPDMI
jgi:transcription initiation factor TFIIB